MTQLTVDYTDFDEVAQQDTLHFFYDAQSRPAMVKYNGVMYTYVHNLQGDIVAILNASGTKVVEYKYDAWGNPIAMSGSMLGTLGYSNPFRYRGYVYDYESGLYYLRSRYYDPEIGRFVNGDSILGKVGELFRHNIFSYCKNNPNMFMDHGGDSFLSILLYIRACFAGKNTPNYNLTNSQTGMQINSSLRRSPLIHKKILSMVNSLKPGEKSAKDVFVAYWKPKEACRNLSLVDLDLSMAIGHTNPNMTLHIFQTESTTWEKMVFGNAQKYTISYELRDKYDFHYLEKTNSYEDLVVIINNVFGYDRQERGEINEYTYCSSGHFDIWTDGSQIWY